MSFIIRSDKKETENKTIRFPVALIDRINAAITNKDVTFSSFVQQACIYALDHLDDESVDDPHHPLHQSK